MTDARFTIDDDGAQLVLSGSGERPSVELVGPRARVTAVTSGRGKTWKAVVALRAARWGGPVLPLPSGRYELHVSRAEGGDVVAAPPTIPTTRAAS